MGASAILDAFGSTRKHSAALGSTRQHSAVLGSTRQHSAALGSTREASGGIGKASEAIGGHRRPSEAIGSLHLRLMRFYHLLGVLRLHEGHLLHEPLLLRRRALLRFDIWRAEALSGESVRPRGRRQRGQKPSEAIASTQKPSIGKHSGVIGSTQKPRKASGGIRRHSGALACGESAVEAKRAACVEELPAGVTGGAGGGCVGVAAAERPPGGMPPGVAAATVATVMLAAAALAAAGTASGGA